MMVKRSAFIVLLLAVFAEASLFTWKINYFGVYISPIVSLLLALFISVFPMLLLKKNQGINGHSKGINESGIVLGWFLFVIGIILIKTLLTRVFDEYEISIKNSDIIPALEIYVSRFLSGKEVYKTFTEFGTYTIEPNYLPLQWLPFVISSLLKFDYRWMAFIVLSAGLFCYQLLLMKQNIGITELIVKTIFPFLILYMFIKYDPGIFGMTVETLIVGYYLMLFASLYSSSSILKASSVLLCLLSRFSFLFWVPLYFYSLFIKSKSSFVKTVIMVGLGICVIYIIPFLSKDWGSFGRGSDNYKTAALGEWHRQSWQQPGEKPFTLFRGIGFAAYFYDFAKGSVEDKLALLKKFHLIFSILAAIATAIFFYFKRDLIDQRLFMLLALKFYLAFFYAFIQQPYAYLNMVPVFLSVFIVSRFGFLNSRLSS